jgi:hypothetical protein
MNLLPYDGLIKAWTKQPCRALLDLVVHLGGSLNFKLDFRSDSRIEASLTYYWCNDTHYYSISEQKRKSSRNVQVAAALWRAEGGRAREL